MHHTSDHVLHPATMDRSISFPSVNNKYGRDKHDFRTQHCKADSIMEHAASPSTVFINKSASIPISNSMRRTTSERQLSQDEEVAEYKDFLFYSRVVEGISRRQTQLKNGYLQYENQMCLAHIVRTRNADSQPKTHYDEDWLQELADFGFVDHSDYSDPVDIHSEESAADTEIFVLDL